jgi:hypothetical protein
LVFTHPTKNSRDGIVCSVFLVHLGSGFFIDKIGNQMAALIFCTLIAAGSVVVAAAPSLPFLTPLSIYLIMLFGRFIFG